MVPETLPISGVTNAAPQDPLRAAAEELQAQFFVDMLKYGGLADALSTGSNALDSMTDIVLQSLAKDLASQDPAFAEALYQQMQGIDRSPED